MTVAISMRSIVKTYGRVRALDHLDLTVTQGEVHAFLGPNGAGKTTAIRVLLGLIRPDAGESQVFGLDTWLRAVPLHRRLAYVPGDMDLWPKLSGGEIIDLFGRLRGGMDQRRRDELIDRFDFDPTKKARSYSKGNRQKVGLISALASDVELLILDEPTSGLDPLMEAVFQDCISEIRDAGRTVLLSSHILAEVEALCDSVSIIRSGQIVETGTLGDLRRLSRTSVSAVTTAPVVLDEHPHVHGLRVDGDRIDFEVDNEGLDSAIRQLTSGSLVSLTCQPPTLEELFLRHYAASTSPHSVS